MIIDYENKQNQKRILSSPTGIACLYSALGSTNDDVLAKLVHCSTLPIHMTVAIKDEQKRRENLISSIDPNPLLGPAYPSSSILNEESVADTIRAIPLPHIVSTYDDIVRDQEAERLLALDCKVKLFDPMLPGTLADRIAKRLADNVFKKLSTRSATIGNKSSVVITPPLVRNGRSSIPLSLEEFYEQDIRHSQR